MDVFLSYASEDRERARRVARALEDAGWSVWWDRKIVAGETFDQTIERYLDAAKCVVVLWSSTSIDSDWVKTEAAAAAERKVLVPALIDDVKIPLEFRRRQTANLIGWEGDTSQEGFQALREGVAARVGGPAIAPAAVAADAAPAVAHSPRPPAPKPSTGTPAWGRWTIAAGGVLIVGVLAYRPWTTPAEDPPASSVVTPTGANSVDNPAPLAFGTLHKVTLERNGEYYFRLPTPLSAMTIVQDVRLTKGNSSNLQTQLDVLDADGGVVQNDVIRINEIDAGYRQTASFSTKLPSAAGIKVVNNSGNVDLWLAVWPQGKKQFLPFFGDVVPQSLPAGKDATGTLEQFEGAYYLVRVPPGEHRVILDFMNAKRDSTNLQGYLAVLDADGGNQRQLARLNEIGVSHRTVSSLTVKGNEPLILRLQNTSQPINYSLRIVNGK